MADNKLQPAGQFTLFHVLAICGALAGLYCGFKVGLPYGIAGVVLGVVVGVPLGFLAGFFVPLCAIAGGYTFFKFLRR